MNKVLWYLFYLLIAVVLITAVLFFFGLDLSNIEPYRTLIFGLPVVLLALHSTHILGFRNSLLFMSFAMLVGWSAETIGLKYGQFFGGEYSYEGSVLKIGMVPLDVTLYWAVFIYTSYSMVNGILRWRGLMLNTFQSVLLAAVADGIILTSIDLFMDPIQVREGAWTWINGGPYFGIPIGNFVGWFVVGFVTTGIFRSYTLMATIHRKYLDNLLLIPTIGYGLLIMSFSIQAVEYQMYEVLLAGITIMGSFFVLTICSYIRRPSQPVPTM